MRIARVEIANFRGLENFWWTPGLENVLLGENNSGKSSILAALRYALDPAASRGPGLTDFDFYRRELRGAGGSPGRRVTVSISFSHLTDEEERHFLDYLEPLDPESGLAVEEASSPAILDQAESYLGFRLTFEAWYDMVERELTQRHLFTKFGFEGGEVRQAQTADFRHIRFFMIPSFRDVDRAFTLARHSPLDNLFRASEVDLEASLREIAELIESAPSRLLADSAIVEQVRAVADAVDRFIPLSTDPLDRMSFAAPYASGREVLAAVQGTIRPRGAQIPLPVSRHGLGTRQLVLFAVFRELARLRGTSILAFEEPEVGLHPNLQRLVLAELRRGLGADRPLQMFCSTHSPVVASQARSGSILVIRAGCPTPLPLEPGPAKSGTPNAENLHRTWYRKFSENPGEFLESVFAPTVLLVEGKSDAAALPLLVRLSAEHAADTGARDLDGLGVTVVSASQGKSDLVKLIRLYKEHYCKQVLVLVDTEKWTEDVDQAVRNTRPDLLMRLPHGWAVERLILGAASAQTLHSIGDAVGCDESELGTETEALRDLLVQRVKSQSLHRLAASLLPAPELTGPVGQLRKQVADYCGGLSTCSEVQFVA